MLFVYHWITVLKPFYPTVFREISINQKKQKQKGSCFLFYPAGSCMYIYGALLSLCLRHTKPFITTLGEEEDGDHWSPECVLTRVMILFSFLIAKFRKNIYIYLMWSIQIDLITFIKCYISKVTWCYTTMSNPTFSSINIYISTFGVDITITSYLCLASIIPYPLVWIRISWILHSYYILHPKHIKMRCRIYVWI